jgi:hypothetical protein
MTTPPLDPPQPNPPLPPNPGLPSPSPVPPEPQPPAPSPIPEPGPPRPEPPFPGAGAYDPADAAANRHQAPGPLAVTPSDKMPRPEGLAFDVEPGADLTGMPVGDQTPRNPDAEHIEETVRETGESIGLAIPANRPGPGEEDR